MCTSLSILCISDREYRTERGQTHYADDTVTPDIISTEHAQNNIKETKTQGQSVFTRNSAPNIVT